MLKTSWRPWRPWRCLNVLCATLERPRRPFGLPSAFNGDLASFVVAQGRHKGRSPCVKGVLASRGLNWATYIQWQVMIKSHRGTFCFWSVSAVSATAVLPTLFNFPGKPLKLISSNHTWLPYGRGKIFWHPSW